MEKKIEKPIRFLPTEETVIYPETDGKPMAETDVHRDLMTDTIQMLKTHFSARTDVYVSGNLLLYYEKGNPKKSIAPDVFVVFGIEKKVRRTYRLWEEGVAPNFVLEIASKATYQNDLTEKKDLYASALFNVEEYFIYDPDKQYLPSSLLGYRLSGRRYSAIQPVAGRLASQTLGLELGDEAGKLSLYDPSVKSGLLRPEEETSARKQAEDRALQAEDRALQAEDRVRQAEGKASQAEERALQESLARQQAEAELARLQAQLSRLRTTNE